MLLYPGEQGAGADVRVFAPFFPRKQLFLLLFYHLALLLVTLFFQQDFAIQVTRFDIHIISVAINGIYNKGGFSFVKEWKIKRRKKWIGCSSNSSIIII